MVISGYEHNAVTRPLHAIPNVTVRVAESTLFDRKGAVEAFRSAITPEVSAVVCCHVSNVFGFILPVEEIAGLCRGAKRPAHRGRIPVGRVCSSGYGGAGHGLYGHARAQGTLWPPGHRPAPVRRHGATASAGGGDGVGLPGADHARLLPDRLEAGTLM